jgi:hypothetical protein
VSSFWASLQAIKDCQALFEHHVFFHLIIIRMDRISL